MPSDETLHLSLVRRAGDEEIEFFLGTLIVDLQALASIATVAPNLWDLSVHPLMAHAVAVSLSLVPILEGEASRRAHALAVAITALLPRRQDGSRGLYDEDAWRDIQAKFRELAACFADRPIKPWVLAGMERSHTLM